MWFMVMRHRQLKSGISGKEGFKPYQKILKFITFSVWHVTVKVCSLSYRRQSVFRWIVVEIHFTRPLNLPSEFDLNIFHVFFYIYIWFIDNLITMGGGGGAARIETVLGTDITIHCQLIISSSIARTSVEVFRGLISQFIILSNFDFF